MSEENLLQVKGLKTYFKTKYGIVKAVDDISFNINEREILAIVGESGCGKSVTATSLINLINDPGYIESGEVIYQGNDILKESKNRIRELRGNEISMIFQEPMTSLNPVLTIGEQITETLRLHKTMSKKEAYDKALDLIDKVGIPRGREIIHSYPHQLSGGMLQRIMIAIAISCDPKLIIADEPTTALDVTIQAQILELLKKVRDEFGTAIILITHDLGIVAEVADNVAVMYAGKIIEEGTVVEILMKPSHPYTEALLKSKPIIGEKVNRLYSIRGHVPNLINMKESCYFCDRCEKGIEICKNKIPKLTNVKENHNVACWLNEGEV